LTEIAELASNIFKLSDMKRGSISRHLFIALLLMALLSCRNHTDPLKTRSRFFVVPHAESYPGFNGHLSWYGRERAGALGKLLSDSGVARIYVTPYSRTLETADSLRLLKQIDTAVYLLDTSGQELVSAIKANQDYGRTLLVVGHPFAVPGILESLGVSGDKVSAADTLPNMLYEVNNDHGKVQMNAIRFGPPVMADTTRRADTLAR
jgi:phosphohistidine phosphatase SixA